MGVIVVLCIWLECCRAPRTSAVGDTHSMRILGA
jgi:hypothetical protein